jgi:hypothetical protein
MWAGAVLVVYGSSGGLADSEMWSQDTSGVSGTAEELDHFGWALTSGDYDGDGYDDLAIGAPQEDYSYEESGVVHVLFGSSSGLTATDNLLLAQDTGSTVAGTPAAFDHFGYSLASGDWNDDGRDDLAVGSPYDDEGGGTEAGVVNVFYGSSSGPSTSGDELLSQDTSSVIAGIDDTSEAYDHFGYALR